MFTPEKPLYPLLGTAVVLVLVLLPADASGMTLDDVRLNEHVLGERLGREALRDRTVILDFWGVW